MPRVTAGKGEEVEEEDGEEVGSLRRRRGLERGEEEEAEEVDRVGWIFFCICRKTLSLSYFPLPRTT